MTQKHIAGIWLLALFVLAFSALSAAPVIAGNIFAVLVVGHLVGETGPDLSVGELSRSTVGIWREKFHPAIVEAVFALSTGEPQKAEALLRSQSENDEIAQYWLAEAYVRLGRSEDAVLAWQRAGAASYFLNLGHPSYEAADYAAACLYYVRASMIEPTSARAQMYAGHCYSRTSRLGEAIQAYSNAIELDPSDGWSYVHLARRYSSDLADIRTAQAILERCLLRADLRWMQPCKEALESLPQ